MTQPRAGRPSYWSFVCLSLCLCAVAWAQGATEEKAPAAQWADFVKAIKDADREPAREAAAAILANRRIDDARFVKLIDDDAEHVALFTAALQSDKVRDPAVRLLERYASIKARGKVAPFWVNFNHYVRIARPEAAHDEAKNLLDQLPVVATAALGAMAEPGGPGLLRRAEDQILLDVVESREYPDFDVTLQRAARIATLKDQAEKISLRISEARINRSRDRDRIVADIQKLSEGERANVNAINRLRSAGQFAAPELLVSLLDTRRAKLHPFVLAAMVSVGRPVVYPLSVALLDLEAVPQGQVAQVLAEIGYPRALPYLKMVLENPRTDANTRSIVEAAYRQLSRNMNLPANVTAAELFLTLGQNYYASGSAGDTMVGFDPAGGRGVVWSYDRAAGLIETRVHQSIFADVLAMRAARIALSLNPRLDAAMSLWLAANLRRENRLPQDEKDPSYDTGKMQAPAFYLAMAGPLRQHDVLHRALDDNDAALALDAIEALAQTAGTDALVNRAGTAQPLLRALTYPDRRVRFAAAFALTNAQPKTEFPGSFRVVPVLSEAVRQTDTRYAVVLGRDENSLNRLAGAVSKLDPKYQPIPGRSLNAIADQISNGPGVDMIITNLEIEQVVALYRQTANDYKLAAVPIVALVSPGDQIELNRRFDRDPRLRPVAMTEEEKQLKPALDQAAQAYAGAAIGAEEAEQLALTSLRLLRGLALNTSNVFRVNEAEAALIRALQDPREPVVLGAASVLALFDTPAAQRAIADVALDATAETPRRAQLIASLTESATRFGSRLSEIQLAKVLELVKEPPDKDLALPASRLHGALTLPTANVAQMIIPAK